MILQIIFIEKIISKNYIFEESDIFSVDPNYFYLKNQKIMLIKGEGGRELLADTLKKRGAIVSHLIAYSRILPKIGQPNRLSGLLKNNINVVIATSGECMANLRSLLNEKNWQLIKRIPLIVISQRLKILAEQLGFQTIWVTLNGSDACLINTLASIRNTK